MPDLDELTDEQRQIVEDAISKADDGDDDGQDEPEDPDTVQDVMDQANELEIGAVKEKLSELQEVEERVDEKIDQLKSVVDEAKRHGKGKMVQNEEPSEEEKQRARANEILEPFGHEMPEPGEKPWNTLGG